MNLVDGGIGFDRAFVTVIADVAPSSLYVPGSIVLPSYNTTDPSPEQPQLNGPLYVPPPGLPGNTMFPGTTDAGKITPDMLDQSITIYRPADTDDEAGARTIGPISSWLVLFKNVPCAMILESAMEANPEDESHQVLEQVARYCFFTNIPVTIGTNAVRDSDIVGIGPVGAPTRLLTVKSWEQWPEVNPTLFKIHGQEVRP